jgi:hypothetical protein
MSRFLHADLLAGIIDYAGLFPPASLSIGEAVDEYQRIRGTPAARMVGPFLIRASDFEQLPPDFDAELGILADLGLQSAVELAAMRPGRVVQIEWVLSKNAVIDLVANQLGSATKHEVPPRVFVEVPVAFAAAGTSFVADLHDELRAQLQVHAKLRTGGTEPGGTPAPDQVATFMKACTVRSLPYKATAGLHHPLRHVEGDGEWQHGFLNVIAAASAALTGADESQLHSILELTDLQSLQLPLTDREVSAVRSSFVSFGSCSVDEPFDDLVALGLIEAQR